MQNARIKWIKFSGMVDTDLPPASALVLFEKSCVGACGQSKVELFGCSLQPSSVERGVRDSQVCHKGDTEVSPAQR